MKRILLSAMNSNSGKTVVTCGLLRALTQRGLSAEGFKCGPDYIDPMFHQRVLGVPCRNLDPFLEGEAGVRHTLSKQSADIALLEGAMGYYDGIAGTTEASAYEVAHLTDTPVVLVIRPKGTSITLAALLNGMKNFRPDSHLVAVILTDCKPMLYLHLKPIIERETGLTVLGYLPPLEEAHLESRHLGLITAEEVSDFSHRFDVVAKALEEHVNLDQLLDLAVEVPPQEAEKPRSMVEKCTIAVAKDEAFCFYYEDNFDALREAGAKLTFFSPLREEFPKEADALYLGGGYPELYTKELSANTKLLTQLRERISAGLPTLAECGGFLYLQQTLTPKDGVSAPMLGVLPGEGFCTDKLTRFGYVSLQADESSMLFQAGDSVPTHEFHYYDCTENGTALLAQKRNGTSWRCGFTSNTLYAAFPHLHFGGEFPLAERFVEAAVRYKEHKHD